MSYNTMYQMAADQSLRNRVAACAAQEGIPNPESWAQQNSLVWAGAPGWDEAYWYALNTGNESPGGDEGVITDAMILAQVQAMTAPTPEEVT